MEHRVLEPAVGVGEGARFGVRENRRQRGAQVAAGVCEHRRHAPDVIGAGIAGDQGANQSRRDERCDIGMRHEAVDDAIDVAVERGGRVGRRRQHHAAEQRLRAGVVVTGLRRCAGHGWHDVDPEVVVVIQTCVGPSGERPRVLDERGLAIGRSGLARRVQAHRAVLVELPQAEGEQLHQLTSVVLVRHRRRRTVGTRDGVVGAPIESVVQVLGHRRTQGHLADQGLEVAKRIAREQPHPRRQLAAAFVLVGRDDDDLAEREDHALAELVMPVGHVQEERIANGIHMRVVRNRALGHGELVIEPLVVSGADHEINVRSGGTEGRLLEEVSGGFPRNPLPRFDRRVPEQNRRGEKCKHRHPCRGARDRSTHSEPAMITVETWCAHASHPRSTHAVTDVPS